MDKKIGAYRRADTEGKSQIDLILMVYDGAIRAFEAASEKYEAGDTNSGFEEMEKAKRFVTHLYTTLDTKQGGEVAENLGKLYVYVLSQSYLVESTKNIEQLNAIVEILRNLRTGWTELKEQQMPENTAAATNKSTLETLNLEEFVTTG